MHNEETWQSSAKTTELIALYTQACEIIKVVGEQTTKDMDM
jgi:hypothetical protein